MAKISLYTQAQTVLLDDVPDSVCISVEARVLSLAGNYWSLDQMLINELRWMLIYLAAEPGRPETLSLPLSRLQSRLFHMSKSTPDVLLREAWPMRILPWLNDPGLIDCREDLLRLYRGLERWFEVSL